MPQRERREIDIKPLARSMKNWPRWFNISVSYPRVNLSIEICADIIGKLHEVLQGLKELLI